jgi:hypothetical protein
MARKKQRTNWKLEMPFADLKEIAPKLLGALGEIVPLANYKLQTSSAVWRRANGSLTARLVYREEHAAATTSKSMVFTIRNIRVDRSPPKEDKVANG